MIIVTPGFEILHITPNALETIERAARTCYKSEDKIAEGTAEKMVRGLITRGHEAMLEFADITVKFTTDRGVSHEDVRHRLCSFAQESTRYVDYGKAGEIQVVCPADILAGLNDENGDLAREAFDTWKAAVVAAESAYNKLRALGLSPQIARSVLPTCTKTELVMKANFREWRHILKLRTSKAAHPQMRELMIPLLEVLRNQVPVIFDDIEAL